ncbi:MAG: rod shape-determining protein MreD [Meiothermus sp.]|nr:rod shape-determining protein MreD [Meiothermus sp.]
MRFVLVILLAFLAQGFLSGLLGDALAPPDLIYLGALLLISSVHPLVGLPLAFALGILQDLLSTGYPGLHAVGLLCAAYVFYRLTRVVHWDELAGQLIILGGSFVAKWLGMLLIGLWLRTFELNPLTLWPVILSEFLLTVLLAPFIISLYHGIFGVTRNE